MSTPPIPSSLPRVRAVRYVTALREGGSLPAILETNRGDLVVAKFRGAGQGVAALVAEIIAGQLAIAADLNVPALSLLELDDDSLARTERDEEISDLLRASQGTNVGVAFLPEAWMFDPAAHEAVDPDLAAITVVFDAFVMNVDRTARNPNLLWSGGRLWAIDHGAALLWHHGWDGTVQRTDRPFPWVRDHVLLPLAGDLRKAGDALIQAMSDAVLEAAVQAVPDALLPQADPASRREAYRAFLQARTQAIQTLVQEANDARASL